MTSTFSSDLDDGTASVSFEAHDHASCVEHGLSAAEMRCTDQGLRFTPVRRKVLELLLQEHRALGAYAILDHLRAEGFGSQPNIAYRALDFLVANELAHKIERLNAFVACAHSGESHTPAFMICRLCEFVAEAQSVLAPGALGAAARASGFQIERTVVEAEGVCPACAEKTAA